MGNLISKGGLMLLRSLLILLTLGSVNAFARIQLDDAVTRTLIADKNIDDAYAVEANMGWAVTAMQVECSSIEILDPGIDPSLLRGDMFACFARPLVRFSQNPNSKPTEITDGVLSVKTNILQAMARAGFEERISKLTTFYVANITCYIPAGTGNSADKPYCDLWK